MKVDPWRCCKATTLVGLAFVPSRILKAHGDLSFEINNKKLMALLLEEGELMRRNLLKREDHE